MKYQIDQSIKIENTQKPSYVCIANDRVVCCFISAKDKRILKLFFRKLDRPLIFKLFIFSVLCAKVINKSKIKTVEIDKEYLGHEIDIKSFITQILNIWHNKTVIVNFTNVGKASAAHIETYKTYKIKKAEIKVTAEEVLILYNLINKA